MSIGAAILNRSLNQRCQLTRIRTHDASFYLFLCDFAYLTRDAYLTRVKKRLFFDFFSVRFFYQSMAPIMRNY